MADAQRRRKLSRSGDRTQGAAILGAQDRSDGDRAALNVLLVEDDPNDELIIRTFLHRSKYFDCNIICADELSKARAEVVRMDFDVIILDFWVKAEDSLGILAQQDDMRPRAPVVVVSSLDMTDVQDQSLTAGAMAYLHKNDLSASALDAILRTLIHTRAKEQNLTRSLTEKQSEQERMRDTTTEMAHEIMATLNAVHGFAEIMTKTVGAGVPTAAYPELIRDGSARLIETLQRYLSRVNTQEITTELRYEENCVIDTVEAAAMALEKRCAAKHQLIDIIATSDEIRAQFDRVAIYHVMVNLIGNAHKYSNNGSPIRITIDDLGDAVKIAVIDQGIGMTQPQVQLALQRFARIVAPAELAAKGNGLGLAVVTSIIDMHGGALEIESFKDWGTSVMIRLPKARPTLN